MTFCLAFNIQNILACHIQTRLRSRLKQAFAVDVTDGAVWESGGFLRRGCCSAENHRPSLSQWDLSLCLFLSIIHSHTHTHSQRFSAFSLLISLIPLPTHKTAKCFSWTHFSACSGLATSAPDPLTPSSNMSSLTGVQRAASQYNNDLEEQNRIHKRN